MASSSDEGSSEAASSDSAASSDAAESSEDDADELLGDSSEPVEFTIEDDVLKGTIESDGQTVTMLFTKDGNLPGALSIDTEKATPITSEADLVGDWKLTGMSMMGMMVYGDADTLSSISGDADTSITFEEGGKCTMSGEELEYSVSEDGAIISESGIDIPVSKLDDAIILDMGTASGMGIDMVFMYTK